MRCHHCGRGLCCWQLSIILVVASAAIGLAAGVAARMPGEGLALGILHAVVPVATMLDEVHS